jgi:hypothetical protein
MAGGWSTQRVDDLDDIDVWIAQRNANVLLRQQAEAVGRDLWDQGTRDGQDVSAAQPSDLVAIGSDALSRQQPAGLPGATDQPGSGDGYGLSPQQPGAEIPVASSPDPGPIVATPPSYRFATARPGDSISGLLGTSDPGAIGRFVGLNGLDGRSSTLQIGRGYLVPTNFADPSPDEFAAGNRLLRSDNARLAVARPPAANDVGPDLFAQRLNSGRNVWTGGVLGYGVPSAAFSAQPQDRPWWDRNEIAKGLAGQAGITFGRGLGALRGGARMAGDAIDDAGLLTRLAMPASIDEMLSPPGMSAREQLANGMSEKLHYLDRVRANPSIALNDLTDFGDRTAPDFIPWATPQADTILGEFGRSLRIGANQGDLGVNLASIPLGGEVLDGASALRLANEQAEAGLLSKFYPQAEGYWGQLYDGAGHHYFSQREGRFANMGGAPLRWPLTALPVPKILRDSELFRLRPEGITNEEMFARHVQSDPDYHGGKIPAEYGGGRWSGSEAGLQTLPPVLRMWHGASLPLKVAVGSGVVGGAAADSYLDDWSQH